MSLIVGDIESDGLYHEWEPEKATRIDCLVLDIDGEVVDGNDMVCPAKEGDIVVFHNGVDYDLRMLNKFWNWDFSIGPDTWCGVPVRHVDTMLLSKLVDPDLQHPRGFKKKWKPSYKGENMPGPHSLEVWAARLGMKKPKLVYGDKMGQVPYSVSVAQATADIEITKALYHHLIKVIKERKIDLKKAFAVEQKVRDIVTEGAEYGTPYNKKLAEDSLVFLDKKLAELKAAVEPHLPSRQLPKSKVKHPPEKKFKINGEPHANAVKYFGDRLVLSDDGLWTVKYDSHAVPLKNADIPLVQTEPMKISDAEVKDWLMEEHGWKPTIWNTKEDAKGKKVKTSPKMSNQGKLCENLEAIGETIEIVQKIVLYLSYANRRAIIKSVKKDTGWLNHPRLKLDGRLPSDADTMGTNTFRFKHRVVTNVPRVGSTFGEEMRGQFIAPEGMRMVGWDAAGLEDRVKAHYCIDMPGGREYADKILDPEFSVHEENVKAWNLPKSKCKNGHYAMQYNCRPPKLAETLGVAMELSDKYFKAWWLNNIPLEHFMEKAVQVWHAHGKKYLPTIDGRWVPCPAEYMVTSRLFQSAGVIAMKYAMVLWYNRIKKMGIPAVQVIHYHDEAQAVCPPEYAEEVGELGCWSIKRAGELLNFKIPLLSEYSIGNSWAETH